MLALKRCRVRFAGNPGRSVAAALLLVFTGFAAAGAQDSASLSRSPAPTREWTLEECIASALRNSHRRNASQFAVEMTEAQHRQALAGY